MNPVFVFIDLQEDFFAQPLLLQRRGALCSAVNDLSGFARRCGFPVIWVRQEFEPDLCDAFLSMRDTGTRITIRNTKGCALLGELNRFPSDLEVVKKRYSAFFGTDLKQRLIALAPSHIIVGGINTHACIRATAVDAFQMDYRVIFAVDAIASYDDEYHRESLRYLQQSIGIAKSNMAIMALGNDDRPI